MVRISFVLAAGTLASLASAINPQLSATGSSTSTYGDRAVLVNQAPGTTGRVAQDFTDFPAFSTAQLDDFTLSGEYNLGALTIFGLDRGDASFNVGAFAEIHTAPDLTSPILATATGSQVGADLQLNFGGATLGPGTYWLAAYVARPFAGGGQWYWLASSQAVAGSESFFHNPGGGFGAGGAPVPGSAVFDAPADMAFVLEGTATPAPGALALLGLGGLVAGRRRR